MTVQRSWLWAVTALTGPFAPIVCFTRDSLCRSSLPLASLIQRDLCRLPGAGPRGGVQHRGQQGVPLPDKNRLFCARATQIMFSASLSFLVNVARDLTPETFNFALSGPRPHLYDCAVHIAVFSFFLLTVGSALLWLLSGHLSLRHWREVFFPSPCISGQSEEHSHLQGTRPSVFIEHFAVLHDLAIKECLWERKNLFRNAVQSFVFSHQGDSPLVPASGYAREGGEAGS